MVLSNKRATELVEAMDFSYVFGQLPPEKPFDFLRNYSTDQILLRIAKINAILYLDENVSVQNKRVLKEVVFEDQPALTGRLDQLGNLIWQSKRCVFSGPVMSFIIKEALENYVPLEGSKPVNSALFAGDLIKAILAYNEHFYGSKGKPNIRTFAGLFSIDIQQQYYLRRERYLKLTTLLKFAFISKFFSEDEKLKKPALEYCRALDIGTFWGLAKFLLYMFERVLGDGTEAKYILERNGAQWPVLEQFVLRKDDLVRERPLSLHKELVPKPYYELDSERLLILDNNYFTYGLDQGVLFSIYNKSSLRTGATFKNYNEFKAYFGLNFFEQYFVGRFIKTIFSKRNNYVVSTEKYQDYIVRAGNNVFIFEVKMTDFNANGLDKKSFDDFRDFIDKSFLSFKQDAGSKAKGFGQIVRQISYLATDQALLNSLDIKYPRKINVYPIIVYSEANLDMYGVNEYVNEKEPERLAQFRDQFQSIRPLIMINGDFFMTYYHLLRKDPSTFGQWINDYLKSISNLKKRYKANKIGLDYMLYNKSFAEHIRRKIPYDDTGLNLDAITANFDIEIRDFGKDIS